jgi:hypothetical protein
MNTTPNNAKQVPVWVAQRQAPPSPAMRGTLPNKAGEITLSVPRSVVHGLVAVAALLIFLAGFVFGGAGAQAQHLSVGTQGTVSYGAPSDQYGPVRAPSGAELKAYGMAMQTASGTCSLEWHGTDGGWWEPVCQGPRSK